MKMLKSKGPKTGPCGIPAMMTYQELVKEQSILVLLFTIIQIIKKNILTYFIETYVSKSMFT